MPAAASESHKIIGQPSLLRATPHDGRAGMVATQPGVVSPRSYSTIGGRQMVRLNGVREWDFPAPARPVGGRDR
jgi:hypothetical protein